MKRKVVRVILWLVLVGILPAEGAYATSPIVGGDRVDRLYKMALATETRSAALAELKEIVADLEHPARQYAFQRMGDLDLPELASYFLGVSANKYGFDDHHWLRGNAQLYYWQLYVNSAAGKKKQVERLIEGLDVIIDGVGARYAWRWSAGQLCNRGVTDAFDAVTHSIKRFESRSLVDDTIRLCRMQMDAMSAYPTRFEALVGALASGDPLQDEKFLIWAIRGLASIGTEAAHDELAKYILTLQRNEQASSEIILFYWLFLPLRKAGWRDVDFTDRGIRPIIWAD